MNSLFEIKKLRCTYNLPYVKDKSKIVLEIANLSIPKGEIVFIVGESGIGKSTILETLGLMNNTIVATGDTEFSFIENGVPLDLVKLWDKRHDKELSSFRLKNFSFIFQSTNLMKNFTAYENIIFTRMLQGYSKYSCKNKVKNILHELGLDDVTEITETQKLSGGQQQRLAFARAIIPDFTVLFGDEPTGNLDPGNAIRVMKILSDKLKNKTESSAIIVSHDISLASKFADTIIEIQTRTGRFNNKDYTYGLIDSNSVYKKIADERWETIDGSLNSSELINCLCKNVIL